MYWQILHGKDRFFAPAWWYDAYIYILQTITCTSYSSILHVLICRASATLGNKWISRPLGQFVACAPTHCTYAPAAWSVHSSISLFALAPSSADCACMHECQRIALVLVAPTNPSWHRPCTYVLQRPNQCVWSFNHCALASNSWCIRASALLLCLPIFPPHGEIDWNVYLRLRAKTVKAVAEECCLSKLVVM